ncbi:MAG: hypothetical protein RIC55_07365 [Pirellulaceae bacterium]
MRFRRILVASILVSLIAALVVWRFAFDGLDPRHLLWPRPPQATEPAALDKVVALDVEQRSLREVLGELSSEHDVPIGIDYTALKLVGIPASIPVSLRVEGVTLRTALRLLAEQGGDELQFVSDDDVLMLTARGHWDNVLGHYTSRLHRLDGLLAADEPLVEDDVALLLRRTIATSNWSDVGGLGKIQIVPGALLIEQTPATHRQITALLDGIERLQRQPHSRQAIDVDLPESARVEHTKILQALTESTSLEFFEAQLDDALAHLAAEHGIAITVDREALQRDGVDFQQRVKHDVRGVRLETALRILLAPLGLTYDLRDDALVVTTDSIRDPQLTLRLYPVADLLDGRQRTATRLIDVITSTVAMDSWDEVGGPGAITHLAGALVIHQSHENHRRLEQLLQDLRQVVRPSLLARSDAPPKQDASVKVQAALAEPISLELHETPLRRALALTLAARGVPMIVADRGLQAYGIVPDPLVTVRANDVPLATALQWMLEPLDLSFTVHGEAVLISHEDHLELNQVTRCYPVARAALAYDVEELQSTLINSVAYDSWDEVGGPGSLQYFGDVLVVSQTPELHRELAAALEAIEARLEAPSSLAPIDVVAGLHEQRERAIAALAQPTDLVFEDAPLDAVIETIAQQHHVPVHWSGAAVEAGALGDARVSGSFAGRRLESALRLMLLSLSDDLHPTVRGGAIEITTRDDSQMRDLHPRIYPTADLFVDSSRDSLSEFLTELIDYDEWDDVGGPATVERLGDDLLITAERATHQRVEMLLHAMRRMRDEPSLVEITPFAPRGSSESRIEAILARPAEIELQDVQFSDALRRICREHDLPLWIDQRGIASQLAPTDPFITFSLHGATLGRALEELLAAHRLGFRVRDEMLVVTHIWPPDTSAAMQDSLRLYRIADLRRRYPPVVQLPAYSHAVEPTVFRSLLGTSSLRSKLRSNWSALGVPTEYFEVWSFSPQRNELVAGFELPLATSRTWTAIYSDVLGVVGPEAAHREVRRLLDELRTAAGLPRVLEQEALLQRRVSLHCEDVPLLEAIRRLSRTNGVPVLASSSGGFRDSLAAAPRVTCDLHEVPLAEAIGSLSSADLPLAVIDADGVAVVTSRQEAEARLETRAYALGELFALYGELDSGVLGRLVGKLFDLRGRDAASDLAVATPSVLVVRTTLRGHADVERLFALLINQADRAPRPYALVRDDNSAAQQQLAQRLAMSPDALETLWLLQLVQSVEAPSQTLAEAVTRRLAAAWERGEVGLTFPLCDALIESRLPAAEAAPVLEAILTETAYPAYRQKLLAALAAIGPAGIDVLAGRFREAYTAGDDEADFILELFARHPQAARRAAATVAECMTSPPPENVSDTVQQYLESLQLPRKAD